MAYEMVIWEVADGVGRLTLNRPDTLNAWTAEFGQELKSVIENEAADDSVRSVLVTSEDIATGLLDRYYEVGARHFVAIAKEPDFDLADLRRLHAWRDSLMLS